MTNDGEILHYAFPNCQQIMIMHAMWVYFTCILAVG